MSTFRTHLLTRLSRAEWCMLLLLLLCYAYFLPRYADWSQTSRVALILAIVHEGRLEIDSYIGTTGDYAELRGHRYSDKAPGPALLGVPPYALAKAILDTGAGQRIVERLAQGEALRQTLKPGEAASEKVTMAIAQAIATWAVVSIPSAVLGVVLYRVLGRLGAPAPLRLLVTLVYGLATSAFPYAGALYSHQLTAALLFGSFALLWREQAPGALRLLTVGLLMGLSLISEYPTALIIGGLGLYALGMTRRLSTGFVIALGALPPLLVMAIHNQLIFGTPLPVGYSYSALWQNEHQAGLYSLSAPTWEAFWGVTFGLYRGLFSLSPVLLFGIVGLALMLRDRGSWPEGLVCAWSVGSFVAFNSSSGMWSGGFGVGPRYLVPMLPFLAVGIGVALARFGQVRLVQALFAVTVAWSLVAVWSMTIGGQAFPGFEPYPLWMHSWPALLAGDVARNLGTLAGLRGWWSLAPLAVLGGLLLAVGFGRTAATEAVHVPSRALPSEPTAHPTVVSL
ncbi:MAG: hypothetical protein IT306_11855 [Chloroflexi bacterium]|nr:hypothetical protein [Chloroflexota bacterium]